MKSWSSMMEIEASLPYEKLIWKDPLQCQKKTVVSLLKSINNKRWGPTALWAFSHNTLICIISDLLVSFFRPKNAVLKLNNTHYVQLILVIIRRKRTKFMQMRFSILIPIKPLSLIVYGSCFLGDKVFAIECTHQTRGWDAICCCYATVLHGCGQDW